MYYSTATGYIIILSPLILLALLATIGIVLYRHPSKLQRKWYSVSFKKRKRIKQKPCEENHMAFLLFFHTNYRMFWERQI